MLALPVAAIGVWLAVRLGLDLTGRRCSEAVWVTADRVVHDSHQGRLWAPLSDIEKVRGRGEVDTLFVQLAAPFTVATRCPRLWGGGRLRDGETILAVDCSLLGHDPEDLATWLDARLGLHPDGETAQGGRHSRSRLRRWR